MYHFDPLMYMIYRKYFDVSLSTWNFVEDDRRQRESTESRQYSRKNYERNRWRCGWIDHLPRILQSYGKDGYRTEDVLPIPYLIQTKDQSIVSFLLY